MIGYPPDVCKGDIITSHDDRTLTEGTNHTFTLAFQVSLCLCLRRYGLFVSSSSLVEEKQRRAFKRKLSETILISMHKKIIKPLNLLYLSLSPHKLKDRLSFFVTSSSFSYCCCRCQTLRSLAKAKLLQQKSREPRGTQRALRQGVTHGRYGQEGR